MADQNCSHHGCTCKSNKERAYPEVRTRTAATIARMRDRPPREDASVATQAVDNNPEHGGPRRHAR
jgi:hypothetical protein